MGAISGAAINGCVATSRTYGPEGGTIATDSIEREDNPADRRLRAGIDSAPVCCRAQELTANGFQKGESQVLGAHKSPHESL